MIQISAVSYLNTLPFIHGIENSGFLKKEEYNLIRDIPSVCAKKLENKSADLILVPVAAIAKNKSIQIVTDYCIGANRNVVSVLLVSQSPLDSIKRIYLDYQSRTSVNLIKILAKYYWKKDFQWIDAAPGYENDINNDNGGVIIGDRALELSDRYKYKYDLSTEWNIFTNLPFVFACWVCTSELDYDFLFRFNKSLEWGIQHLNEISPNYPKLSNSFIRDYYKNNIDYHFDSRKKEGMSLFFKYLNELS